jgi:hypothetical protein
MNRTWQRFREWLIRRFVSRPREFRVYNVAPREGVFRIRRKLLRQLLKSGISNSTYPK